MIQERRSQARIEGAAIAEIGKIEPAIIARQHAGPQPTQKHTCIDSQTVAVKHKDTGPSDLMHASALSIDETRNRTYMTHAFNGPLPQLLLPQLSLLPGG
jgi:hypothetical protein